MLTMFLSGVYLGLACILAYDEYKKNLELRKKLEEKEKESENNNNE